MEDELFIPPGAHLVESPEVLDEKSLQWLLQLEYLRSLRQANGIPEIKPREDKIRPTPLGLQMIYDPLNDNHKRRSDYTTDATYHRPNVFNGLMNTVGEAAMWAGPVLSLYKGLTYTLPKYAGMALGRTNAGRALYLNRALAEELADALIASKNKMLYIKENDPFFVPQDPVVRDGAYGPEILYGTRTANPWQLAMGEDMIQRLRNLGYNVEDFTPVMRNGSREVRTPQSYIRLLANTPIDMVVSENIPSNIVGYHTSKGGNVYKVNPGTTGLGLLSTLIHESLMHGTDDLMLDIGTIPSSPDNAVRNIPELYKNWSNYVNDLPERASENSNKWYELRATLGELRALMYKAMARAKGKEFYNKAEVTPELRAEFEKAVDGVGSNQFKELLSGINDYGKDYASVLDEELWLGSNDILNSLKNLIKYMPTTTVGISSILTPYLNQDNGK